MIRRLTKAIFWGAGMLGLVLAAAVSLAGTVVGEITAIDYTKSRVEINGMTHLVSKQLVEESSSGMGGQRVELSRFRYGQVVDYGVDEDGLIYMMTVRDGVVDIPQ